MPLVYKKHWKSSWTGKQQSAQQIASQQALLSNSTKNTGTPLGLQGQTFAFTNKHGTLQNVSWFLVSFIADTICVKSYFNLLGSKNVSGMGWRPVHDLATLQHGPLVPFVVVSDKTQASEKCNRLTRKKTRNSEDQIKHVCSECNTINKLLLQL